MFPFSDLATDPPPLLLGNTFQLLAIHYVAWQCITTLGDTLHYITMLGNTESSNLTCQLITLDRTSRWYITIHYNAWRYIHCLAIHNTTSQLLAIYQATYYCFAMYTLCWVQHRALTQSLSLYPGWALDVGDLQWVYYLSISLGCSLEMQCRAM